MKRSETVSDRAGRLVSGRLGCAIPVPLSGLESSYLESSMLSIIIPVLNEEESLGQLWTEIQATADSAVDQYEVIFIDDGSTDRSWAEIRRLSEADERVSGIRFRRNFGKAAALTAGMQAAQGHLILMMDADLQDDPAEIPSFLQQIDQGSDVVNGWKQRRLGSLAQGLSEQGVQLDGGSTHRTAAQRSQLRSEDVSCSGRTGDSNLW